MAMNRIPWNGIYHFPNKPWFLRVCSTSFENTVGNGEIARYEQFLRFPLSFLPIWRTFRHFHSTENCPQILSVWKSLKFIVWESVNNSEEERGQNKFMAAKGMDKILKHC